MLSSFYVKNYRNLERLQIDSLGQVNLISGKNNTGKSSLLEAISIYANRGSLEAIVANMTDRKEYVKLKYPSAEEDNIRYLSPIFFNRKMSFRKEDRIEIGHVDPKDLITLRFVYYQEKSERDEEEDSTNVERIITDIATIDNIGDLSTGFEIKVGAYSRLLTLQRSLWSYVRLFSSNSIIPPENNQFIHTNNINREINSLLFDKITLTDKEQYIIEALKIIEPNTERIAFIDNNNVQKRIAVIKLSNTKDVVPLSSMGDGINRILTIILALVNSNDGYLLIDEFENGLHYTVQEQLWVIIFKLAKELNVQVFATTHSNDCISSFNKVLNRSDNTLLGKYIRLDNVNGEIKQIEFSPEELKIAEQQDIELR